MGHLVHSCTWAVRANGLGIVATCVLQRCVGLLGDLAGPAAAKMDYVRTICCALLYNTQWHDHTPGAAHVEERCEALLAKLRARCTQHPDKHTADEAGDLFRTIPPPPPVSGHMQRSPSPKVCVLRCGTGYGHLCVVQDGRSIPLCDGRWVQSVWLRQKETQHMCSPKREPGVR